MFKEKWQGFKYLFSDKEMKASSVLAFLCMVALVLGKYLYAWIPNERILIALGILAVSVFWYLFWFFVLFNLTVLFGKFRDNRKRAENTRIIWIIRSLSIIIVLGMVFFNITGATFLAVLVRRLNMYLMIFSFFAWVLIESFFLVKLFFEISDFTTHRLVRLVTYVILCVGYGVYLWFMIRSANPNAPESDSSLPIVSAINENLFDVILTLVLFYFAFASMGKRFLPESGVDNLDFDHLSWREELKLRNTAAFIFFIAIGFQIFLRGLNFLFGQQMTLATDFGYYLIKFIVFVFMAALTFLLVLFRKPGQTKKKKKK